MRIGSLAAENRPVDGRAVRRERIFAIYRARLACTPRVVAKLPVVRSTRDLIHTSKNTWARVWKLVFDNRPVAGSVRADLVQLFCPSTDFKIRDTVG